MVRGCVHLYCSFVLLVAAYLRQEQASPSAPSLALPIRQPLFDIPAFKSAHPARKLFVLPPFSLP